MRPKASIKERILLHLLELDDTAKYAGVDARGILPITLTQEGMATAVNAARGLVSRALDDLRTAGFVTERLSHIRGKSQRIKAYFLTHAGRRFAHELNMGIEKAIVITRAPDGKLTELRLGDVAELFTPPLTTLNVLNRISKDGILDLKVPNVLGPREQVLSFLEDAPKLRHFFGRHKEMNALGTWLHSETQKIMVIKGIAGIGKSALLSKFVMKLTNAGGGLTAHERDKNILWYTVQEWSSLRNLLEHLAKFLSAMNRNQLAIYLRENERIDLAHLTDVLNTQLTHINALLIFDDIHKAGAEIATFFKCLFNILQDIEGVKLVALGRWIPQFYDREDVVVKRIVAELMLEGLDARSAKEILKHRDVRNNLRMLCAITGGHPLCLMLIDADGAMEKDVAKYIREQIFSKLADAEKTALSIVSVFRKPFLANALFTNALVDYDVVDSLTDRALLQAHDDGTYDMHDLIRNFFYKRLTPNMRVAYHKTAASYYMNEKADYLEALFHLLAIGAQTEAMDLMLNNYSELIASSSKEEVWATINQFDTDKIDIAQMRELLRARTTRTVGN